MGRGILSLCFELGVKFRPKSSGQFKAEVTVRCPLQSSPLLLSTVLFISQTAACLTASNPVLLGKLITDVLVVGFTVRVRASLFFLFFLFLLSPGCCYMFVR